MVSARVSPIKSVVYMTVRAARAIRSTLFGRQAPI
jgi:hypothetical protein